jgi:hypothetical protein
MQLLYDAFTTDDEGGGGTAAEHALCSGQLLLVGGGGGGRHPEARTPNSYGRQADAWHICMQASLHGNFLSLDMAAAEAGRPVQVLPMTANPTNTNPTIDTNRLSIQMPALRSPSSTHACAVSSVRMLQCSSELSAHYQMHAAHKPGAACTRRHAARFSKHA